MRLERDKNQILLDLEDHGKVIRFLIRRAIYRMFGAGK
jgi:hypothetical protein